jgi:hypothetical protein
VHGKPVHTTYDYTDSAWAKSDDEFTRPSLRTYSDWRGYRKVAVTKGSKSSQQGDPSRRPSRTPSDALLPGRGRRGQGLHGRVHAARRRRAAVRGYGGGEHHLPGSDKRVRLLKKRTLNYPWSKQTASRAEEAETGTDLDPLLAHRSGIKRTDEIQTVDTSWRAVRTLTDGRGHVRAAGPGETAVVKPSGSGEVSPTRPAPRRRTCTTRPPTDRAAQGGRSTGDFVRRVRRGGPGHQARRRAEQLRRPGIRRRHPTKGLPTSPPPGSTVPAPRTRSSRRPPTTRWAASAPSPSRARVRPRPSTPRGRGRTGHGVKTINAQGPPAVTTTFDPGRSLALTVTDANGRVTRSEYDALGPPGEGLVGVALPAARPRT